MAVKKQTDLLTRSVFEAEDLEVRVGEDGKSIVTGYAAVFEKLSVPIWGIFREKIRKGAFVNSIAKSNVRALWNHNRDIVLGATRNKTMKLSEDEKGLHFELELPDTNAGRDAAVSIGRRDVDGVSFGFRVLRQEWDEKDPKNVIRTLIEVDLREISPTPFPAYPQTSVKMRSIKDEYEDYQAESGAGEKERNVNKLNLMNKRLDIYEKEQ